MVGAGSNPHTGLRRGTAKLRGGGPANEIALISTGLDFQTFKEFYVSLFYKIVLKYLR